MAAALLQSARPLIRLFKPTPAAPSMAAAARVCLSFMFLS
ncbi:hypothetical protein C4J94_1960 [Pseudomonas sp. R5-89-07]|nr:hypothetical protein C4J94_1960 [Pseudomonas sp. R5-89-07]